MNTSQEKSEQKVILLHPADNTITALADLFKGDDISVKGEGEREMITLISDIAYAHKLARTNIHKGADVIKYGEVIGIATDDIQPGDHVHVHNVDSKRAKGDGS